MQPLRNSLYAFAFGAVAALGHAPFGLWWAALLGFSGLIWAATRSPRQGLVAWSGGAGYFGVTLHWIVEPFLVDAATHGWMAPFALILMAGGLAAFWGLAGWVAARLTPGAIGLALWLTAAEMTRGHVFTGFPWALPGYIWAETPVRMTVALYGSYGLTALTLLICALPFAARSRRGRTGFFVLSLLGLAGLFVGGALREGRDYDGTGEIALIQPNAPQNEKWDPERAPVFARRLIDFTGEAVAEDEFDRLKMAIWPESAVIWPLDRAGPVFDEVNRVAPGLPVLTGINRREGEDWHNSAVVAEGGAVTQTYDKVHLVPFGEYIPFRIDLLRRMASFTGFGFAAGDRVRAIDTPLGRAIVFICYEAIFPGHVRRAEERPDLLIQITNDAWFGTFAGPYQHLDQARFRAAEQGLPLYRAANTGISASIDARGEVKVSIPLGTTGWTTAQKLAALPPTPYARAGDLPVALFLALAIGLSAIVNRKRR